MCICMRMCVHTQAHMCMHFCVLVTRTSYGSDRIIRIKILAANESGAIQVSLHILFLILTSTLGVTRCFLPVDTEKAWRGLIASLYR